MNTRTRRPGQLPRWAKPLAWLLCGGPFVALIVGLFSNKLGANPVEAITHETGEQALRLLLVTLAVTPLRRLTGWQSLAQLRRLLGLFAFFYVVVHFATYAVLDASFDLDFVVKDIIKRPYITAGFVALVLLLPLAATSTRGMQRRLGGRRWSTLHRAVYLATAGAVLHFVWQAKVVGAEELVYAGVFITLLVLRLPSIASALPRLRARRSTAKPGASPRTGRANAQ